MTPSYVSKSCRAWVGRALRRCVCTSIRRGVFAPKALWRHLGIGLERRHSGNGPEQLRVPLQVNRLLKSTILGAARSAIAQGENPFADQHRRWIEQGLSAKLARRNVARSLSATLWGLWKNGTPYHPEWVGVNWSAIGRSALSS